MSRRRYERLEGLDVLRGIAMGLMALDHFLVVSELSGGWWLRITLTRLCLPLFCLVAGSLFRPFRWERYLALVAAAALSSLLEAGLGFPRPSVLVVFALVLPLTSFLSRLGVWGGVACVVFGAVQPATWVLAGWSGYQPGELVVLLLCGAFVGAARLDELGRRLGDGRGLVALIGRWPLTFYVAHLAVLLVAVFLRDGGVPFLY